MRKLSILILSLFLYLPLIIYSKEVPVKYPTFDTIESIGLYRHAFEKDYFKKGIKNPKLTDTECLAYVMYSEARGEPDIGQVAVGYVVKNRAIKWDMSLCQVAKMPGEFEVGIKKLYGPSDESSWWHTLNIAFFLNERDGYATIASPVGDAIYFNSLTADEQIVMGKGRFRARIGHHYFYGAKKK